MNTSAQWLAADGATQMEIENPATAGHEANRLLESNGCQSGQRLTEMRRRNAIESAACRAGDSELIVDSGTIQNRPRSS